MQYASSVLKETVGYDIFKMWEDLFLSQEEQDNMLLEGIQTDQARSEQAQGPRQLWELQGKQAGNDLQEKVPVPT